MSESEVVSQGRAAWARLRAQERLTWDDWIAVGKALLVGRAICMKAAQVNLPKGGRYNHIAARWLADNGLNDISAQERHRICRIIENLDEVTRWRDALPAAQRRRINHPSHWATFCAFKSGAPRPQRHHRPEARPSTSGRAIYWSQDIVRRCAMAMKESGSRDWFKLARIGLEAAIANDVELFALLEPARKTPQPATAALEVA